MTSVLGDITSDAPCNNYIYTQRYCTKMPVKYSHHTGRLFDMGKILNVALLTHWGCAPGGDTQKSFYRLQCEAVTTSHLLNQTTHDSIANLCKWRRVMIQSLPNAVGMFPRPPEPGAAFGSFKEFIIGSKLSIQLLQTLRIDDFSKNTFYIHTALLLLWMDANKRGQYYFQILLAIRLPALVSSIISGLDYSIFGHLQTQNGFFKWKQDWECLTPEPFWLVVSGQCRRGFPSGSHSAT